MDPELYTTFKWARSKRSTMLDSSESRLLRVINVVGFLGVVAVNVMANALPLNGNTTAELSDAYPNLFVPAGYVFSIWGVIYILLLVFTVYQFRKWNEDFMGKIGYLFALSCASNIVWIFLWHYEYVLLSLLAMFALLGSLIMIYLKLNIGKSRASREERLYVHLPFSVYLGWITVAPIANVVAALVYINWDGFGLGEVFWTVAMIAVATLLTVVNLVSRGDVVYSLVIIWALAGIVVKQMSIQALVIAGVLGIAILFVTTLYIKFTG
jgi:benzodiazapine receptor